MYRIPLVMTLLILCSSQGAGLRLSPSPIKGGEAADNPTYVQIESPAGSTVHYRTISKSATSGVDYVPFEGSYTDQTNEFVEIFLIPDGKIEPPETFVFEAWIEGLETNRTEVPIISREWTFAEDRSFVSEFRPYTEPFAYQQPKPVGRVLQDGTIRLAEWRGDRITTLDRNGAKLSVRRFPTDLPKGWGVAAVTKTGEVLIGYGHLQNHAVDEPLRRVTPRGEVDLGFKPTLPRGMITAMALTPEDKILLALTVEGDEALTILRLNADGSRDATFPEVRDESTRSAAKIFSRPNDGVEYITERYEGTSAYYKELVLARGGEVLKRTSYIEIPTLSYIERHHTSGLGEVVIDREAQLMYRYERSGEVDTNFVVNGYGPSIEYIDTQADGKIIALLDATNWDPREVSSPRLVRFENEVEPANAFSISVSDRAYETSFSGQVQLYVRRTGDTSEPATVRLRTVNGSAEGDRDFVATNIVLEFPAFATMSYPRVQLLNDDDEEQTEMFSVVLEEPSAGGRVHDGRADVELIDLDLQLEVQVGIPQNQFGAKRIAVTISNRTGKGVELQSKKANERSWSIVTAEQISTGTYLIDCDSAEPIFFRAVTKPD